MKTKSKYSIGKGKNKIVLAEGCPTCDGRGWFMVDDNEHGRMCDDCDGCGAWATEDGLQVLKFINDILLDGRK